MTLLHEHAFVWAEGRTLRAASRHRLRAHLPIGRRLRGSVSLRTLREAGEAAGSVLDLQSERGAVDWTVGDHRRAEAEGDRPFRAAPVGEAGRHDRDGLTEAAPGEGRE